MQALQRCTGWSNPQRNKRKGGHEGGNALNDDGDVPPNEADSNEPWHPDTMNWFMKVKNNNSKTVKRQTCEQ